MSKNSATKYFKYAIGEIFLVVIGILIALQINNWNENRKDRNLELDYYCRIYDDFKLTKRRIADTKLIVNQQIEHGKQVILDLHNSNKTKEVLLNDWLKFIRLQKFVPSNTAYQDLISSGNLKLLKDIELKNSLAIYYANLENLLTQINQNRDILVESSFQIKPAEFGIQHLGYLKKSLGAEIIDLLPDIDWIHNPQSEFFMKFQNDMVLNIALLERQIQHMSSIINEMEKPYALLKNKCIEHEL